jgi:hypothetical protein
MDMMIGTIATGLHADLALFAGAGRVDHRAVLEAEPQDVLLVLRDGKPLAGDAAIVGQLPDQVGCEPLDVCSASKSVCLKGELTSSLATLTSANGSSYPLFSCGPPKNEPSCVPTRPTSVNGSTVYTGAPGPWTTARTCRTRHRPTATWTARATPATPVP